MPATARHIQLRRQRLRDRVLRERVDRITAVLRARSGEHVVGAGPFRGMSYPARAAGSELLPKLVGSYEEELAGIIELLLHRGYKTIVNVGCGEGYYAVGFARRLPEVHVFAFDTDPIARALCQELAACNDVADRVTVGGRCSQAELIHLAGPATLVICDCEGCERELFAGEVVPALHQTDLIVELHDFLDPTISHTLVDRFRDTHATTLVATAGRRPEVYECLAPLSPADREFAVNEARPAPMQWAVLISRHAAQGRRAPADMG